MITKEQTNLQGQDSVQEQTPLQKQDLTQQETMQQGASQDQNLAQEAGITTQSDVMHGAEQQVENQAENHVSDAPLQSDMPPQAIQANNNAKPAKRTKKQKQPSNQEITTEAKPKYYLKYSIGIKCMLFFIFLLMTVAVSATVIAVGVMLENRFYTSTEDEVRETLLSNRVDDYLPDVIYSALQDDSYKALNAYCDQNQIAVTLQDATGNTLFESVNANQQVYTYAYQSSFWVKAYYPDEATTLAQALAEAEASVLISFTPDGSWSNPLSALDKMIVIGYGNRYFSVLNGLFYLAIGIVCFFNLFAAIGHSPKGGQIVLSTWTKIPFDLFTLLALSFSVVPVIGFEALSASGGYLTDWQVIVLIVAAVVAIIAFVMLYGLNVAVRCKAGTLCQNTLVYKLCAFVCRYVVKLVRWIGRWIGYCFAQLPFIWKALAIPLGMIAINLIVLWYCVFVWYGNGALYLLITAIQMILLVGGYLYLVLALNHLAKGAKTLAQGDVSHKIESSKLCFELKAHAENLNQMGEGITKALNEQLKSERMKTELITNVSHDIKTPLTSIINYADLLSKQQTDNAAITEYTAVIARQSERLKRLIEDLVEASKASTGNLEVNLLPCEVGVLLSQAVGEYQQRLEVKGLQLIAKQPGYPLSIMADGRHLWRVFDNLLNNIDKYAQGGTRVYLTVEQKENNAIITFKNISKYPLDISAEELMERFVRGDDSRHDEGNGLGLSIAQSLTELQGGVLTLHVDGDLFKVELSFALVGVETAEKETNT